MKNYWDSLDLSLEQLMRNGYCHLPSVKEYVDLEEFVLYQMEEEKKTSFDLNKRLHSLTDGDRYDYDDIIIEINGALFNQQDMQLISQLSEIIQSSGEIGSFELGNLKITINSLDTYEHNLIKVNNYEKV